MKKGQLVEMINNRLGNTLSDRTCALFISTAFESILFNLFAAYPDQIDLYRKSYTVTVSRDITDNIWKATLTKGVMQVPSNCNGMVIDETLGQKKGLKFVPTTESELAHLYSLDTGKVSTKVAFCLTGKTLSFYWGDTSLTSVIARYVPLFEDLEMSDDIHIPLGKDIDIVGMVLNVMNGAKPDSLVNDGNDRT